MANINTFFVFTHRSEMLLVILFVYGIYRIDINIGTNVATSKKEMIKILKKKLV